MISLDVIIPYYGDPNYLFRAIESVRGLIDTDWRLTIVEDCYPGGAEVQRRVAALGDDRIRYLRNAENLGVAGNQHRCMQLGEREHFVVLDADDVLLPNYGKVLSVLINRYPDAAMFQPGVQVIDENGAFHRPLPDLVKGFARGRSGTFEISGEEAVTSLLRGNWLYTPALCYRRDISADLPQRTGTDGVNDLAMVIDMILRGGSLVVSQQVAFQYRRHRASHSSSYARSGERFVEEKAYFESISTQLRERGWNSAVRAANQRLFSRLNALTQLPSVLQAGERDTARRLLRHALR
ncbi:glycosyltransferase [Actinoalloteichus hymeniacidonis]|uniref:Glycosyl transferase family 2 n=1 Tax=Actinoalloteichus hymeniacidonis TaxID=340345 RepID=A0AAC9HKU0_9PSEU|nr:glycosyltransferase [Actinoalloteichus hymeniacidonis]AOS60986.1 Glycosyl transferase family 2 [Actinoalloteichus hymeniacidonis]MBB5911014.1 glycosyltransferase involved in cell wall biosynthesis [Actinoalloteichus hymeniacidonis]